MTSPRNQHTDRRNSDRLTTLKWAQILFPDNITSTACAVLNVSASGALLQIDPTEELPREFWLAREDGSVLVPCTIRWRIGGQIGVMFLAALSQDAATGQWLFNGDDEHRPKEIRSPFLRHPLVIS